MSGPDRDVPEVPSSDALRDGIGEEDNKIPAWFNISWIASWIIGVIYICWYVFFGNWSAVGQYQAEVAVAEAKHAAVRAALPSENPYRTDAAAVAAGQEVFVTVCAACHLPDGRGLVGPSLIDPYWKYGRSDPELYASVADGRPGGMPAWGAQLGSEKIWKALAFMETLPSTDEPGFGAPDYVPPAP